MDRDYDTIEIISHSNNGRSITLHLPNMSVYKAYVLYAVEIARERRERKKVWVVHGLLWKQELTNQLRVVRTYASSDMMNWRPDVTILLALMPLVVIVSQHPLEDKCLLCFEKKIRHVSSYSWNFQPSCAGTYCLSSLWNSSYIFHTLSKQARFLPSNPHAKQITFPPSASLSQPTSVQLLCSNF